MTVKEWLHRESEKILNLTSSEKISFFRWVEIEGENKAYDHLYRQVIEENKFIYLETGIKQFIVTITDADLEKIANSSAKLKDIFIHIVVFLTIQLAIKKITNTLLKSALKKWEENVIKLKISLEEEQKIKRLLAETLITEPFLIPEEDIDVKKLKKMMNPPYRAKSIEFIQLSDISILLKEILAQISLSTEENDFLKGFCLKYFNSPNISKKDIEDINLLFKGTVKEKIYIRPDIHDFKKLLNTNTPTATMFLQEELRQKYVKKQLAPEHEHWIELALPKIAEIYDFLSKKVGFYGNLKTQKPKHKNTALSFIGKNPAKYWPIKKEHLEDISLYSKFKSEKYSANRIISHFFGCLFNKIFKDNNLPTIGNDIIYEKFRKTDYWKGFRELRMKNQ